MNMTRTQTTPKKSRISPNIPKCNQISMIEGRKGLEIRSDYPNISKEVYKCDYESKGRANMWMIEISYHNQVILLTSKASQNQQKQLQTEIMLGLGVV